jgi:acyl-CoA reductase-like NAD-dependent aldehyde dehydrogenase
MLAQSALARFGATVTGWAAAWQPVGGIVEPMGVCARITAYNYPLIFSAGKFSPPIAAGNTVIIKLPPQAPNSAVRMMELLDGVLVRVS